MWDGHGHTAVFNTENQQGPAGQHRNSAQCHVAAWMGGELAGGMDAHIRKAGSLCCSPEIIITLLTGYAPKQNEKFGKKKIGIEAFSSTVKGW